MSVAGLVEEKPLKGFTVCFARLPSAGKTTIATLLDRPAPGAGLPGGVA
jgi:adenylylsulfate kinase-like enzyme